MPEHRLKSTSLLAWLEDHPNVHDCEGIPRRGELLGLLRLHPASCEALQRRSSPWAIRSAPPMHLPASSPASGNITGPIFCIRTRSFTSGRSAPGGHSTASDDCDARVSLAQIAESPGLSPIISVNSPRRFDEAMSDGLIAMAEHGQAVVITPFTLMGAMAPASLAAALAHKMPRPCSGSCSPNWCGPARRWSTAHSPQRRHAFRSTGLRNA